MTKLIGYARVSTKEQELNGTYFIESDEHLWNRGNF